MGIEIFGFSDHVPCPYQDGYVSNIRMTMKQAPEYVETIRRLEAEYRDQVKYMQDLRQSMFRNFTKNRCGCSATLDVII